MKKNYIAPQAEVMQINASLMQDSMNVINHSGGGGFTDENMID